MQDIMHIIYIWIINDEKDLLCAMTNLLYKPANLFSFIPVSVLAFLHTLVVNMYDTFSHKMIDSIISFHTNVCSLLIMPSNRS